jgi:homoserine acetyltransferase
MPSSKDEIQYYDLHDFKFHNGVTLPNIRVAYKIINPHNSKIAIVHTCFRGRIDSTLTHANRAFRNHKVIVVALFGNGESSSPSNTPDFPKQLEYMDCVAAQHKFLTEGLEITEVDVMLGFSMGGQITYHWIATHPSFVKNAVIVCSSARTSRHNFQFLEGPRAALENAKDEDLGKRAFGKAYSAWLTSAEWFDQEKYTDLGFQSLSEWDEMATGKGYDDWTGDDLLVMLGMWQRGDIARCVPESGGSLEAALKSIRARVLLMPSETDQYFRPYVNEREAQSFKSSKHATVETVPSIWGHIVGGGANPADVDWMDKKIVSFIEG